MARSVNEIRNEIERAVNVRADVFRRQAQAGFADAKTLREERAAVEADLRNLWEELRDARTRPARLSDLTPVEVRTLIRANPRLVLA